MLRKPMHKYILFAFVLALTLGLAACTEKAGGRGLILPRPIGFYRDMRMRMIDGRGPLPGEKKKPSHDISPECRAKSLAEIMEDAKNPEIMERANSFFENTLFIGDSRTRGIETYASVTNADFFSTTGMSVFDLFTKTITVGESEIELQGMLEAREYERIYIMLGINELGYGFDLITKKYASVVDELRELQPNAEIIIQANMHVTQNRSEKDKLFNNTNINRLNDIIRTIADERGLEYLDVNPLFDDEQGNLSRDYTYDHTHVIGKYYNGWCIWIYYNTNQSA